MWRDESFIPPLYSSLMISLSDSVPPSVPFRCFTYPKTLLYDTSPSVSDPSLPLLSVPRSMNRKSTYIVPHDSVPDPMTPVYTCQAAPVPNTHSSRTYDDLPVSHLVMFSLKCFGCSRISQDRSDSHPSCCRLRCCY